MTFVDFIINIVSGGIVGAGASYVASKYFQMHNNIVNKPTIEISEQLIKKTRTTGNQEKALQIKILNLTDKSLANIVFEIKGLKNLASKGSSPYVINTFIASRSIMFISEYDPKDDHYYHYAHSVNIFCKDDKDIQEEIKNFEKIRLNIYVECPYYGTTGIFTKEYEVNDENILSDNYNFNIGKDTGARKI